MSNLMTLAIIIIFLHRTYKNSAHVERGKKYSGFEAANFPLFIIQIMFVFVRKRDIFETL
jgi:hypothetical protein